MEVYAVGKIKQSDSSGSARLLLYALFEKEEDAERYRRRFAEKYYKQRPCLCPMEVKRIKVRRFHNGNTK